MVGVQSKADLGGWSWGRTVSAGRIRLYIHLLVVYETSRSQVSVQRGTLGRRQESVFLCLPLVY